MREIKFELVAHIGEMDRSKKNLGSHHGAGLAVSRHPEAWGRIARIGTAGFILRPAACPFRFLDRRSMSDEERAQVTEWAFAHDYLIEAVRFKVSYTDIETDERRYILYKSRDDAEAELEEAEEGALDIVETFEATTRLIVSTDQIARQQGKITDNLAFDLALTCYAEQLLDVDGVWWSDRLRPQKYSAPYGTLLRTDGLNAISYDFSDFGGWDDVGDFETQLASPRSTMRMLAMLEFETDSRLASKH
ncbi:hypothetical protein [Rhizobium sp.]|uniref:hypothetical protein n=1 Tax=Rhizobium sp. TaxID=391 RepID=UPI0028A8B5A6